MLVQNIIEEPREVIDYEITYSDGATEAHTIDVVLGDDIDWSASPLSVTFKLVEKPSTTDPDIRIAADEVTIFLQHVRSIAKRPRLVKPVSPEQKADWKQTLHRLTGSVN